MRQQPQPLLPPPRLEDPGQPTPFQKQQAAWEQQQRRDREGGVGGQLAGVGTGCRSVSGADRVGSTPRPREERPYPQCPRWLIRERGLAPASTPRMSPEARRVLEQREGAGQCSISPEYRRAVVRWREACPQRLVIAWLTLWSRDLTTARRSLSRRVRWAAESRQDLWTGQMAEEREAGPDGSSGTALLPRRRPCRRYI